MLVAACMAADAADFDSMWEYGDPAASERRFTEALGKGSADDDLELTTQIARTYSLRARYGDAHRALDSIQPRLSTTTARVNALYLLERARTLRSSGDPGAAKPLFRQAYDVALGAAEIGLAVDAAHMLALVTPLAEASAWTGTGVELARSAPATDAKARGLLPALLNNHAWNLHDAGRPGDALPVFIEAEAVWRATGRQPQSRIATWSVARCLRSLGRYDEALGLQRKLELEWSTSGGSDGYVFEEIAENLDQLGRAAAAKPYYARAVDALGKDPAFVRDHAARLQRLKDRAR
jgi:tetratricopeptide (TPR) repeat protein